MRLIKRSIFFLHTMHNAVKFHRRILAVPIPHKMTEFCSQVYSVYKQDPDNRKISERGNKK